MSQQDRTKWDTKYRSATQIESEPSRVLTSLDTILPRSGRAIDVAGGVGRHSVWLAERGLDVTLTDISAVGLALARKRAKSADVRLATREIDFDEQAFPPGPWDLILSCCFLNRTVIHSMGDYLSPSGIVIVIQPTRKNLERHEKPPAPFLLREGELPNLISGLDILNYEEGWLADGRHDALLVACRARNT